MLFYFSKGRMKLSCFIHKNHEMNSMITPLKDKGGLVSLVQNSLHVHKQSFSN